MTTTTRNNAYRNHRASGRAGTQCEQILALLRRSRVPLLRAEIAGNLGMFQSSVCARLDELRHMGAVVVCAPRQNPATGVECDTYRAALLWDETEAGQVDLFAGVAA